MKDMQLQRAVTLTETTLASGDRLRQMDLEHYLRRGRELRAQALRAALGASVRGLAALAQRAYRTAAALGRRALVGAQRAHERRRAERALLELNDYLLKDIGLTRGQIHAAVDGLLSSPHTGRVRVVNFRRPPKPSSDVDHLESAA